MNNDLCKMGVFYSREVFKYAPLVHEVGFFIKTLSAVWEALGYSLKEVSLD